MATQHTSDRRRAPRGGFGHYWSVEAATALADAVADAGGDSSDEGVGGGAVGAVAGLGAPQRAPVDVFVFASSRGGRRRDRRRGGGGGGASAGGVTAGAALPPPPLLRQLSDEGRRLLAALDDPPPSSPPPLPRTSRVVHTAFQRHFATLADTRREAARLTYTVRHTGAVLTVHVPPDCPPEPLTFDVQCDGCAAADLCQVERVLERWCALAFRRLPPPPVPDAALYSATATIAAGAVKQLRRLSPDAAAATPSVAPPAVAPAPLAALVVGKAAPRGPFSLGNSFSWTRLFCVDAGPAAAPTTVTIGYAHHGRGARRSVQPMYTSVGHAFAAALIGFPLALRMVPMRLNPGWPDMRGQAPPSSHVVAYRTPGGGMRAKVLTDTPAHMVPAEYRRVGVDRLSWRVWLTAAPPLKPDSHSKCLQLLRDVVRGYLSSQPQLQRTLVATHPMELVAEGHPGPASMPSTAYTAFLFGTGGGSNAFGRVLMDLRTELLAAGVTALPAVMEPRRRGQAIVHQAFTGADGEALPPGMPPSVATLVHSVSQRQVVPFTAVGGRYQSHKPRAARRCGLQPSAAANGPFRCPPQVAAAVLRVRSYLVVFGGTSPVSITDPAIMGVAPSNTVWAYSTASGTWAPVPVRGPSADWAMPPLGRPGGLMLDRSSAAIIGFVNPKTLCCVRLDFMSMPSHVTARSFPVPHGKALSKVQPNAWLRLLKRPGHDHALIMFRRRSEDGSVQLGKLVLPELTFDLAPLATTGLAPTHTPLLTTTQRHNLVVCHGDPMGTFVLDVELLSWHLVVTTGPVPGPGPRTGHAAAFVGSTFMLFGGTDNVLGDCTDLWALHLQDVGVRATPITGAHDDTVVVRNRSGKRADTRVRFQDPTRAGAGAGAGGAAADVIAAPRFYGVWARSDAKLRSKPRGGRGPSHPVALLQASAVGVGGSLMVFGGVSHHRPDTRHDGADGCRVFRDLTYTFTVAPNRIPVPQSTLRADMLHLLDSGMFADVSLLVRPPGAGSASGAGAGAGASGGAPTGAASYTVVPLHAAVLYARAPALRPMLTELMGGEDAADSGGVPSFDTSASSVAVRVVLEFLYTGGGGGGGGTDPEHAADVAALCTEWGLEDSPLYAACATCVSARAAGIAAGDQRVVVPLPASGRSAQLVDDMAQLLRDHWLADVQVEVAAGVRLPAHRCLLAARSDLFRAVLDSGMSEAISGVVHVGGSGGGGDDARVPAEVAHALLEFLYTDNVTALEAEDAAPLATIAARHMLPRLTARCYRILVTYDLTDADNVLNLLSFAESQGRVAAALRTVCLYHLATDVNAAEALAVLDAEGDAFDDSVVETAKRVLRTGQWQGEGV